MRSFYVTLIALFTVINASAGDKGNGGYSVVCRDSNGLILSAELLDIYEGKIIHKRKYQDQDPSILIESVLNKVNNYFFFQEKLKKELSLVSRNLIFIPEGNELEPTDDAFPPIKKKGCEFEQVANYTNQGELLISEEIHAHFDNVSKAALLIHEAIYSLRRKSVGDTNSESTRRLVSQLLAADADSSVIEKWIYDSLQRPHNNRSCGLKGSIEERIESCSYVEPGKMGMKLVLRTPEKKEVWFDPHQGLLWSDRLSETMNFAFAKSACDVLVPEMGMLDYDWRLPASKEYAVYGEALINVLPNLSRGTQSFWFWTSTQKGRMIETYNGEDGKLGFYSQRSFGSVRCVAKI